MAGQRGRSQDEGVDRFAPFPRKKSDSLEGINQRKEEPKKSERKSAKEKENGKKPKPQKSQNTAEKAAKTESQRIESQEMKKGEFYLKRYLSSNI